MASKVRSLEKALQERKAKIEGAEEDDGKAKVQQFSVEGEVPRRMPRHGETVEFTWAEPNLLGAPQMHLGFLVSYILPESKDGRINGWCIMDPTMQTADRQGRPVPVPPLIPVVNAAYSRERKPMTWRFHADNVEVS